MIKSLTLHEIIAECGDFEEGERIKHDRCYCESRFTFSEKNLEYFNSFDVSEINKELEPFNETFESLKGRSFVIYGESTYYDGAEWDSEIYEVIESENPLVKEFNSIVDSYLQVQDLDCLISDLKSFAMTLEKTLPKVSEER